MIFNSVEFLCFFLIVLIVYYIVPQRTQKVFLLIVSCFFYMCWDIRYIFLQTGVSLIAYAGGGLIAYYKERRGKIAQFMLITTVVLELAFLFVFKYFHFFMKILDDLLGLFRQEGVNISWSILLPAGISFYVFQAVSYLFDVYREKVKFEKNFLDFALYISFFPKLTAGPIERAGDFIPQISKKKYFEWEEFKHGIFIMLLGFFQKMVIADHLSVIVNHVYNNYTVLTAESYLIAVIAFSIQIYCDFAGYSLIAIGCARVLGYRLTTNFDSPYLSSNINEFWRRWHISLSSWFRDYIYIPLGGNRRGYIRKYRNLFIVFAVSGLWHGADYTYLVWGCLNGIMLILYDLFKRGMQKRAGAKEYKSVVHNIVKVLCIIGSFALSTILWIFFRADHCNQAIAIIQKMVIGEYRKPDLTNLGISSRTVVVIAVALIILIIYDVMNYLHKDVYSLIMRKKIIFRWGMYIFLIMYILIFGVYGPAYSESSFIYTQF